MREMLADGTVFTAMPTPVVASEDRADDGSDDFR
jgi:hypothetical protein